MNMVAFKSQTSIYPQVALKLGYKDKHDKDLCCFTLQVQ